MSRVVRFGLAALAWLFGMAALIMVGAGAAIHNLLLSVVGGGLLGIVIYGFAAFVYFITGAR